MDPKWRHPYGLRPTLRQGMIVVVFAALGLSLFRGGKTDVQILLLPLAPPLLAVLVLVFERTSPAKFWLAGLLASLFPAGLAAGFDLAAWRFGMGGPAVLGTLAVVNAVGLASLGHAATRLPEPCPGCGLRSLLPLGRRARGMRWCASCGLTEKGIGSPR